MKLTFLDILTNKCCRRESKKEPIVDTTTTLWFLDICQCKKDNHDNKYSRILVVLNVVEVQCRPQKLKDISFPNYEFWMAIKEWEFSRI
jgi:hypothetical protein